MFLFLLRNLRHRNKDCIDSIQIIRSVIKAAEFCNVRFFRDTLLYSYPLNLCDRLQKTLTALSRFEVEASKQTAYSHIYASTQLQDLTKCNPSLLFALSFFFFSIFFWLFSTNLPSGTVHTLGLFTCKTASSHSQVIFRG